MFGEHIAHQARQRMRAVALQFAGEAVQRVVEDRDADAAPVVHHSLDGYTNNLKGYASHPLGGLMGFSFAEQVWLES